MTEIDTQLRAISTGDRTAFEQLYRTMQRPLLAYAANLLAGDRGAAEDAVDEAFLDVWRQAGNFAGTGSGHHWLRRIVRNKAVDWLRRSGRLRQREWVPEDDVRPDEAASPEESALASDSANWLQQSLNRLSIDQREAVQLCYFEGLSLARIAELTDCPEGTVKTRLYHARKRMRAALPADLSSATADA